jgi:Rieske Fe-S protein
MADTQDLPVRRSVLAGIGAVGAAAVLAGCGGAKDSGSGTGAQPPAGGASATQGDAGSTGGDSDDTIKTTDIPVGGGKIFDTANVVVTQPTAGEFKAFSATCTHAGCQVATVQGGIIHCPCHGSQYSIVDGSVKVGPAPRPLPAKTVSVTGDTIAVS